MQAQPEKVGMIGQVAEFWIIPSLLPEGMDHPEWGINLVKEDGIYVGTFDSPVQDPLLFLQSFVQYDITVEHIVQECTIPLKGSRIVHNKDEEDGSFTFPEVKKNHPLKAEGTIGITFDENRTIEAGGCVTHLWNLYKGEQKVASVTMKISYRR